MAELLNLTRVRTATTGTGSVVLGAAVSGFLTFALAGAVDGHTYAYSIRDGANSEVGYGVYTAATQTLTRTVRKSTNADSPISLSGSAEVLVTPSAEDLQSDVALGDGTAAAPALAFVADDDTGLYRIGANEVGFSVGGAGTGFGLSATAFYPITNDAWSIGKSGKAVADYYGATGHVFDLGAGDVLITHAANSLAFSGASSGYSFDAVVMPAASDGAALGSTTRMWSDAFFASGAVLNWNNGNVTLTHSAGALAFAGATAYNFNTAATATITLGSNGLLAQADGTDGYFRTTTGILYLGAAGSNYGRFSASLFAPAASDGTSLGSGTLMWSDLFLASGGVINFNNDNYSITHSAGALAFGNGQATFSNTTAGTSPLKSLNTTDNAAVQVQRLDGDRATPASNDSIYVSSYLSNASGTQTEAMRHAVRMGVVTAGAETADTSWSLIVSGALTQIMWLGANNLYPNTNDGVALGAAANSWSDLFLASGGVINWNNGTYTLTQSSTALVASGIIRAAAGTNSAPTYSFGGDTNTGMYSSAADVLEFATGGTRRVFLDNSSWTPSANDSASLGQAATSWSDLFLASGAVINLNNGDVTLTHSADTLTMAGGSLVLPASGLQVGSSNPFSDSAGTLTLQNVDALDATTENTIEAAIDTLANLTSVQGCTVTLADAGFDVLLGWDDSGNAYKNFALADLTTEAAPAAGDYLVIYGAEGDLRRADWSTLPGAGGGISNVVEDTTPQLGGDLDTNGFDILVKSGDVIELGHATDTTLARSAAGVMTIEGSVVRVAGTETIWIPAAAMKAKATTGAGFSNYDSGSNDVAFSTMDFDTTTQEYAHTVPIGMPKSWNEGTVTAIFYWTNTAGASTETVRWSIAGAAISDDDTLNTTFGTAVTVDDTWLAQNDLHISSTTAAITIGGTPAENDLVIFEITRVVASDNMAGDARLIGVKILITTNAKDDT